MLKAVRFMEIWNKMGILLFSVTFILNMLHHNKNFETYVPEMHVDLHIKCLF
jgi:hypothetical protein